uniref:Uncharacterized protein n=1 Tax=Vitis vinifera TaxID=29760 RepID=A5B3J9_VITVI|nr:hypothetical protein VITISV_038125 [Vitis vinifera]
MQVFIKGYRCIHNQGQQVNRMVQEEYTPSSSFNICTTPGFWTMEASIMLAGPSTDAGIGEILDRRIRQRTTPNGENLVSAAPISPEQRRQHSGGLNTEQGGQQNNCSLQLHGSGRGAQLTIQVRNDMGLQGSGGTIQYQGRIRVREHWWLFGVIYQSEDEDCEDDEIRLDINDMPDESTRPPQSVCQVMDDASSYASKTHLKKPKST